MTKQTLNRRILLAPVLHHKSDFYKSINIPGHLLINDGCTLFESTNKGRSLNVANELLQKILSEPIFIDNPDTETIVRPYKTAQIIKDESELLVYRAELLVAKEFPATFKLLGKTAVLKSTKDNDIGSQNPEYTDWLGLTLRSPFDVVRLIYQPSDIGYSSRLSCERNQTRANRIHNAMAKAHIGI